ncbi:MAG: hypothetical protein IPM59_06280 [Chloracidobacterium sp.]|nr:hypothetical protein [Chloracidobacterium sp.]
MKTAVFAIFVGLLITMNSYSQDIEPFKIETVTLKTGQQKTAKMSGLKIKFLGVTEDSRCPTDVQCIWAGNAVMKFRITGENGTKDYEFNSTIGRRGDQVGVWAVSVDTLDPAPHSKKTIAANAYCVKLQIVRLTR